MSAAGPIEVERTLYRRKTNEKSVCPLELQAGIVEGQWTPKAAKQALWVTAHVTPQEGEDLFKEFANMQPSKSSLDRLPKKIGERFEGKLLSYQEQISQEEILSPDAVSAVVSLDGVMIPMQKKALNGNSHKVKGNDYKEASCGTLSFYDETGERLSTIQLARMPEYKKMTLKEQLTKELAKAYEKNPDLIFMKIADGAKDNWDYLENILPIGGSLLDFYHMSEHLKAMFDAAYGQESTESEIHFQKYQTILKEDEHGAKKLIRAIEYLHKRYPKKKKIKQELTYFRNNRHRMNYAMALEANLAIGSGVVEAACKTLVSQRLKRSGMRWAMLGGQAILTFRSLIKSKRFNAAWDLLREKTIIRRLRCQKNVVEFPG